MPSTISRLEAGQQKATFSTLKKLAAALGVEARELAGPGDPAPEVPA